MLLLHTNDSHTVDFQKVAVAALAAVDTAQVVLDQSLHCRVLSKCMHVRTYRLDKLTQMLGADV